MTDPVIVEVTVAAPAKAVWRALTDPTELHRWHGWDYDGLADEIRIIYVEAPTISEDELVLDTGNGRFALEPQGETTVVRVTRAAPEGQTSWDGIYDEINEGWLTFVQQLRYYLERHPGEDRRSFHVDRRIAVPEGTVWFRSANQTGVLLGEHGLCVVGQSGTVVSTYGLDAAEERSVRERLGV